MIERAQRRVEVREIRSNGGRYRMRRREWENGELTADEERSGQLPPPPPPPPAVSIRWSGNDREHGVESVVSEIRRALVGMNVRHRVEKARRSGVYDVDGRYLMSLERFESMLTRLGVVP